MDQENNLLDSSGEEKINLTSGSVAGKEQLEIPEENPSLKQIRTFQGDVAEAIAKQKESLVSIQRAEQKLNEAREPNLEEIQQKRNIRKSIAFTFGTIFLVFLGAVGGWYGYTTYRSKSTPPQIETPANRFIVVTGDAYIDAPTTTPRDLLIAKISEEISKEIGPTEVKHLVLKNGSGLLSTQEFMRSMRSSAPGNLVRAFNPLFMLGVSGGRPISTFI